MTPPKKWPERAEWARQDAVALLGSIQKRAREAQKLIADGRTLEAVLVLGRIADAASDGKTILQNAKNQGKEKGSERNAAGAF